MGSLDGEYRPFTSYPLYSSMAPCMRSCNADFSYNGCDNAACWCNKANLDLRIATMTRCASTSCTFANMNTATDLSILSGIQVQYCADHNHSPAGMALPSAADATPTENSSTDPTNTAAFPTGSGPSSRTSATSGPSATDSSNPSNTSSNFSSSSSSSSGINTAAKAGIAIGAAFCILLAIAIILLLRRRKHPQPVYIPPPASNPNFQNQHQVPPMAPTPYSGNGPFSPPPMQHPAPLHIPQGHGTAAFAGNKGDVSPIEEKAPMVGVARKEVGGGGKRDISPQSSPPRKSVQPASPAPASATTTLHDNGLREVAGSEPPTRHEVANDGEITYRGSELDAGQQRQGPPVNQYPGQGGYQESRQGQWGYGYAGQGGQGSYEVDGGNGRHELPGQQGRQGYPQYGGTYELGTGR